MLQAVIEKLAPLAWIAASLLIGGAAVIAFGVYAGEPQAKPSTDVWDPIYSVECSGDTCVRYEARSGESWILVQPLGKWSWREIGEVGDE